MPALEIISVVVVFLICLSIGVFLAFNIMALILYKSNNLGQTKAISDEFTRGFIINESESGDWITKPSERITNPVIIKNMYRKEKDSYLDEKTFNTIEDEINSQDLSGIKWHN